MTTVKYDMSKNYFTCYNESQGIMGSKKKILRKKQLNIQGYLQQGILMIIYTLLISICSKVLWYLDNENLFVDFLDIIIAICIVLIVVYYVAFLIAYLFERKKTHKGELKITEDGITDISEEKVTVGLPWNEISALVVSKNTVTVVTKSPVYFFVNNDSKDKLIKAVKKYREDLEIIEM